MLLETFRYGADGQSNTVNHVILPWGDIAGGLYIRSAVSYRTRVLVHPDTRELTTRIVLDLRSPVRVARERSQILVIIA
jgi:hypothetical protein